MKPVSIQSVILLLSLSVSLINTVPSLPSSSWGYFYTHTGARKRQRELWPWPWGASAGGWLHLWGVLGKGLPWGSWIWKAAAGGILSGSSQTRLGFSFQDFQFCRIVKYTFSSTHRKPTFLSFFVLNSHELGFYFFSSLYISCPRMTVGCIFCWTKLLLSVLSKMATFGWDWSCWIQDDLGAVLPSLK